jgi:hypothetical protein
LPGDVWPVTNRSISRERTVYIHSEKAVISKPEDCTCTTGKKGDHHSEEHLGSDLDKKTVIMDM